VALWLIGWRLPQAFGGSMLSANSAAILPGAFPRDRRGFAPGVNQTAILAGQFIGLTAGGLLTVWDWRAVFWVNAPVGIVGPAGTEPAATEPAATESAEAPPDAAQARPVAERP
jgi:MFS family permease